MLFSRKTASRISQRCSLLAAPNQQNQKRKNCGGSLDGSIYYTVGLRKSSTNLWNSRNALIFTLSSPTVLHPQPTAALRAGHHQHARTGLLRGLRWLIGKCLRCCVPRRSISVKMSRRLPKLRAYSSDANGILVSSEICSARTWDKF